ncbi:MAG: hypothetical protein AB1608_05270 [Thermoproteota archaeon]
MAQNSDTSIQEPETESIVDIIVINLVSQIGPIVAGFVSIGIQFARKQGLKISADAEEYFVKAVQSFVTNQSRFVYKQIRSNPEYIEAFKKGIVPEKLKADAKTNVIKQLKVELMSDEFTKVTRNMLIENLDNLVERAFTTHKSHMVERTQSMLKDLIPIAVNAALLSFKDTAEIRKEQEKIIQDVLETLRMNFDLEDLLMPEDIARTHIKAELNKVVGIAKAAA